MAMHICSVMCRYHGIAGCLWSLFGGYTSMDANSAIV